MARPPSPSDVSDEEWAFVAPSLTLMDETAQLSSADNIHEVEKVLLHGREAG